MCLGTSLYKGAFVSRLSRAFGARVLGVDYPLCPEATPMQAVEACVKAYRCEGRYRRQSRQVWRTVPSLPSNGRLTP